MKKFIPPPKMRSFQFMKPFFGQFFLLIVILCWLTPGKAAPRPDFVPSGSLEKASIVGYMNGQSYSGLGNYTNNWIREWADGVIFYYDRINMERDLKIIEYPSLRERIAEMSTAVSTEGQGVGVDSRVWAVIDYVYRVRKKHPRAPEALEVPVIIHYQLNCSILAPSVPSAAYLVWAAIYFYSGSIIPAFPQAHVTLIHDDRSKTYDSIEASYSRSQFPDDTFNIRMVTEVYISHANGTNETMRGQARIDPIVTIDPTFMVEIDGEEYPANEVYKVEISKNLTPKLIPAIPLLLLNE